MFSRVDEALADVLKHPLAHLSPSEVVTIGILQALRGDGGRAFYRWLKKELGSVPTFAGTNPLVPAPG